MGLYKGGRSLQHLCFYKLLEFSADLWDRVLHRDDFLVVRDVCPLTSVIGETRPRRLSSRVRSSVVTRRAEASRSPRTEVIRSGYPLPWSKSLGVEKENPSRGLCTDVLSGPTHAGLETGVDPPHLHPYRVLLFFKRLFLGDDGWSSLGPRELPRLHHRVGSFRGSSGSESTGDVGVSRGVRTHSRRNDWDREN